LASISSTSEGLAGNFVAQANAHRVVHDQRSSLVQQQMPKFMSDGETLAPSTRRTVNTNDL
jgi:hypothetical protein